MDATESRLFTQLNQLEYNEGEESERSFLKCSENSESNIYRKKISTIEGCKGVFHSFGVFFKRTYIKVRNEEDHRKRKRKNFGKIFF